MGGSGAGAGSGSSNYGGYGVSSSMIDGNGGGGGGGGGHDGGVPMSTVVCWLILTVLTVFQTCVCYHSAGRKSSGIP